MGCHANILVIDYDHGAAPFDELEQYGCTVDTLKPGDALNQAVGARGADLVIIRATQAPAEALAAARAVKADPATRDTPVLLISDGALIAAGEHEFAGVVDDVLPAQCNTIELYARVRSLARLHVMQSELVRRGATQRRFGYSRESVSAAPVDADDMRVLVAGDAGEDADAVAAAVNGDSHLAFAADPHAALSALDAGEIEAMVVAVDANPGEWLTMCRDIRDNPRLFNLPILVLAGADTFDHPAEPVEAGATDLLARPVDEASLRARLRMLVKEQRYRRRVHDAYARSRHMVTGDSLTGLFSFGFLHDYLTSLVADAEAAGKPLSLGLFDIHRMAEFNRQYGYAAGDRLLRQVGGLVGHLVRGEDLTARCGGEEFCVVMPGTPREVGAAVLRRIADVIGQTEFGVVMDAEPVLIRVTLGCAGLEPGDSAESLIARARDNLA
ncbi:MAG: diguanylate cyclase [Proteobacteria bacterium]|nr:diguanylate cyclase [Pseudomonadota bacterium]